MSPFIFKVPPIGFAEIQKIIGDDPFTDGADFFGYSVAVDGNVAVVGAINGKNATAVNIGTAYIYEKSGNTWTQVQRITAGTSAGGADEFGESVAVSGNTVVVGAIAQSPGGVANAGAAFVFEKTTSWPSTPSQILLAADPVSNDFFGSSVAIEGNTIAIGADGKTKFTPQVNVAGAVYIFEKTTTWNETQRLIASDTVAGDRLGTSVAIEGTTIVSGARTVDVSGTTDAGAVYVFEYDGNIWNETTKIRAGVSIAYADFGVSVDISGNTIIVGAWELSVAGAGKAYIFEKSTTWPTTETAILSASNGASNDRFGYGVTINGNVAVVGGEDNDGLVFNAGAAYVFRKVGTWNTTTESKILYASDGTSSDRFGISVNYDGTTLMVGAKQAPSTDGNNGAVYIFE